MILEHLPAFQVMLPLIGAALCALIDRPFPAWLLALVISLMMPVIAVLMLMQVLAGGPISYEMGGWEPPYGIEYRVDIANAFVLILVSVIAAVLMPYARRSVGAEIAENKQAWFYCMYLLCLSGLLGIAITGDAFNAFVFLEISSLSSYVLIALGSDRRALIAAYQYLILGTIGATFYVIGVGLLYSMTGTLNFVDLAARIAEVEAIRPVLAALAFLTVGISLKLALFPLHVWLPNAYAFAPSVATVFMAATATKVAVYLLLRYFFSIFGVAFVFESLPVGPILLILSVAAMFAASTVAIFQDNAKRMLAYSSVAQIGYMLLGASLVSATGLTAAIVHMFNHALAKGALFIAVACLGTAYAALSLDKLAGAGRRMPLTMAGFVLAGLSLIGIPGTAGFIGKWYLVLAALELGPLGAWLILPVLASSLLAVLYVWRVVEAAYFAPAAEPAGRAEAPWPMLAVLWGVVLLNVWFGLQPMVPLELAADAAARLLE